MHKGRGENYDDKEYRAIRNGLIDGRSIKTIAREIGRPEKSVKLQITEWGKALDRYREKISTPMPNNHRKNWSKEDDERLKTMLSENKTHAEIAEILDRSKNSVTQRVFKLLKEKPIGSVTTPPPTTQRPIIFIPLEAIAEQDFNGNSGSDWVHIENKRWNPSIEWLKGKHLLFATEGQGGHDKLVEIATDEVANHGFAKASLPVKLLKYPNPVLFLYDFNNSRVMELKKRHPTMYGAYRQIRGGEAQNVNVKRTSPPPTSLLHKHNEHQG